MKIEEYVHTAPCIVCDKLLESALPGNVRNQVNQPMRGTCFVTHGHYGSTTFDPMNGMCAEINICDECWEKRKHRILFFVGGKRTTYED